MHRLAFALAVALVIPPASAVADDEGSEHSAQLVGDEADTLGVTVRFDDKAGWSMAIRAKPGVAERTIKLPLPTHHAHYVVHVAPGRTAITFVEVSAGVTKARMQPRAADRLAWLFSPRGNLVEQWSYGQVLSTAELANLDRSISHVMWTTGHSLTRAGMQFEVAGGKRTVVLDPQRRSMR